MVRQRGQPGREVALVLGLKRLPDALVPARPLRGRQLVVQGVAHQRMRKLVTAGLGQGIDQAGCPGLGQGGQAGLFGQVCQHPRQQLKPKLAAEHCGMLEHTQARGAQAVQAHANDCAHPFGNHPHAVTGRQPGRSPRLMAIKHQFRQEQGVALGLLVQRRSQLGRRGGVNRGDKAGGLGRAEAAQQKTLHRSMPVQLRQGVRQRVLPRHLRVAVSAKQQQAAGTGLGDDEFEQAQGRHVSPVQVVDHQQDRLACGSAAPEAGNGIKKPESAPWPDQSQAAPDWPAPRWPSCSGSNAATYAAAAPRVSPSASASCSET